MATDDGGAQPVRKPDPDLEDLAKVLEEEHAQRGAFEVGASQAEYDAYNKAIARAAQIARAWVLDTQPAPELSWRDAVRLLAAVYDRQLLRSDHVIDDLIERELTKTEIVGASQLAGESPSSTLALSVKGRELLAGLLLEEHERTDVAVDDPSNPGWQEGYREGYLHAVQVHGEARQAALLAEASSQREVDSPDVQAPPLFTARRVREIAFLSAGAASGEVLKLTPQTIMPAEQIVLSVESILESFDAGAPEPLHDPLLGLSVYEAHARAWFGVPGEQAEPSGFVKHLFALLSVADYPNMAKLRAVFPQQVEAFVKIRETH